MPDLARQDQKTGANDHRKYAARDGKTHDKLFPGDSKRVALPWNRQMTAAFPALIHS